LGQQDQKSERGLEEDGLLVDTPSGVMGRFDDAGSEKLETI